MLLLALFLNVNACADQAKRAATRVKKSVSAIFTEEKITVDGQLDEAAWQRAPVATDFIQKQPYEGEPATEKSEVYFLYDHEALYIGAVLYNSRMPDLVTNELKRDFFPPQAGDLFTVLLDTFHDGRNSYAFETNPGGAKRELQSFDQGRLINTNWDTVWHVKTSVLENSWIVEMAIPFKSLRFPKGESQVWGLQIEHFIRAKNEDTYWTTIPRQFILFDMTYAGELHGLQGLDPGESLRVTPFVVSTIEWETRPGQAGFDTDWDGGVDVKYGIGTGLVLDVSYRTDFSQVEVDEQQINLTRFSLFFPEKRVFFLENAGFFQIGDRIPRSPRGITDILPFFSRRIGLSDEGEVIRLLGGARLTGKIGRTQLGVFDIQTQDHLGQGKNNYAVARVSREIFSNSSIGGFFFNRDSSLPDNYNRVTGIDAKFNFFARRMDINTYLMKSYSPNVKGDDEAARVAVTWKTNKQDVLLTATTIGNNFRNDVGFTARTGVRIYAGQAAQKFRPQATYRWVREYVPQLNYDLLTDQRGRMLTRFVTPGFNFNFSEGSTLSAKHDFRFERLLGPFQIHPSTTIPPGDYTFGSTRIAFTRNASHRFSGDTSYSWGSFFDGNIKGWELAARFRQSEHMAVSAKHTRRVVTLPHGNFSVDLSSIRLDHSFNTRAFLNAFVQYNSQLSSVVTNIRFNFIYRPLSNLFLVYTRTQSTNGGFPTFQAIITKFTYLFDF